MAGEELTAVQKAELLKVLRARTCLPLMECKRALLEANWDIEKAIWNLKCKSLRERRFGIMDGDRRY